MSETRPFGETITSLLSLASRVTLCGIHSPRSAEEYDLDNWENSRAQLKVHGCDRHPRHVLPTTGVYRRKNYILPSNGGLASIKHLIESSRHDIHVG